MNARLEAVLHRYPADLRPISEPIDLGNAGGFSGSHLWRFESGRGPLVARAWPGGVGLEDVRSIHSNLQRAKQLDFIPIPFPALDGGTVQDVEGRVWEVCPWMPGEADLGHPPATVRVRAAFSGLARFHLALETWKTGSFSPGLLVRAREVQKLLDVDLNSWTRTIQSSDPDPRRDLALRWIESARRAAPRIAPEIWELSRLRVPIQTVIRDARPDHFLFTGDRLTGLVDFGAMGLDPVTADLARLLSEWLNRDERPLRAEALAAYSAVRALEANETLLIEAFERSAALLSGGHWLRWHFVDRIAFSDPQASLRGLERGVARLESLVWSP